MHMQVFGANIGTRVDGNKPGKSVVVYITTLTMGFSGRVFFFFFLGLAFWVGFLNQLTLEQEMNGDGVDEMGCLQSHGCGISALSD